jgi:hypothetical protein
MASMRRHREKGLKARLLNVARFTGVRRNAVIGHANVELSARLQGSSSELQASSLCIVPSVPPYHSSHAVPTPKSLSLLVDLTAFVLIFLPTFFRIVHVYDLVVLEIQEIAAFWLANCLAKMWLSLPFVFIFVSH